ncbi:hypothetical protein EUZ85_12190 [Hahella sp. KA22]|uniref:hypothetical protein n=1 Tax=Hahella sp. KA22 TaxID=1628392 RepID=UPI000FDE4086|nr:hypothetical protein [Hahella sp. KA22]AZZ91453.1 hypothetical protein ENC22_09630 [Hahella sp. KA22]QAY54822.1 hypothetical protein EUZ85_12190 [Hahella sp. KA22]
MFNKEWYIEFAMKYGACGSLRKLAWTTRGLRRLVVWREGAFFLAIKKPAKKLALGILAAGAGFERAGHPDTTAEVIFSDNKKAS